jgi:hypothetical protein
MDTLEPQPLEDPQLQISGLRIWIHGRQFPNSDDYWDGNWLRVTAECRSQGSRVRVHGPIIHLGELSGLSESCKRLYETLSGAACLDCMEPELNVKMTAKGSGQIELEVSITPDNLNEKHIFRESIDQSYLPSIIASCEAILAEHPVKSPHGPAP